MATHISRGHQGEKEKQDNTQTHINSKHEDRGATCDDDDKSKFKLLKDIKENVG